MKLNFLQDLYKIYAQAKKNFLLKEFILLLIDLKRKPKNPNIFNAAILHLRRVYTQTKILFLFGQKNYLNFDLLENMVKYLCTIFFLFAEGDEYLLF